MYKPTNNSQHSFLDYNQPIGMHMNPKNIWIDMAGCIPWDHFARKYAELFPGDTGNSYFLDGQDADDSDPPSSSGDVQHRLNQQALIILNNRGKEV